MTLHHFLKQISIMIQYLKAAYVYSKTFSKNLRKHIARFRSLLRLFKLNNNYQIIFHWPLKFTKSKHLGREALIIIK